MICQVSDPGRTRAVGRALAGILRPGDLVVLAGPLGAGKTVLAQGIGEGLAVTGPVTSPTFVIARVHRPADGGGPPMVHVDAYRLGAGVDPRDEVDDLDLDAGLAESVTVVEWGEGVVEHLADAHLLVRIDRPTGAAGPVDAGSTGADAEVREVALLAHGGDWVERLADLELPVGCTRAGARD